MGTHDVSSTGLGDTMSSVADGLGLHVEKGAQAEGSSVS